MLKLNSFKSYLKLETPLYLVKSYQTPKDLLQSLRPQPNIQHQYYCGPRRLRTPYYLQTELTLYLTIRSFNCKISLKLIQTTSLLPKLKQPMSLAVLAGTYRRIYVRNTPRTQQTPSSLKKKWLTTYLLFIRTPLRHKTPTLITKLLI